MHEEEINVESHNLDNEIYICLVEIDLGNIDDFSNSIAIMQAISDRKKIETDKISGTDSIEFSYRKHRINEKNSFILSDKLFELTEFTKNKKYQYEYMRIVANEKTVINDTENQTKIDRINGALELDNCYFIIVLKNFNAIKNYSSLKNSYLILFDFLQNKVFAYKDCRIELIQCFWLQEEGMKHLSEELSCFKADIFKQFVEKLKINIDRPYDLLFRIVDDNVFDLQECVRYIKYVNACIGNEIATKLKFKLTIECSSENDVGRVEAYLSIFAEEHKDVHIYIKRVEQKNPERYYASESIIIGDLFPLLEINSDSDDSLLHALSSHVAANEAASHVAANEAESNTIINIIINRAETALEKKWKVKIIKVIIQKKLPISKRKNLLKK